MGDLEKIQEEEDNVGGNDVTKHSQTLDSKQRCFILKFQAMILESIQNARKQNTKRCACSQETAAQH